MGKISGSIDIRLDNENIGFDEPITGTVILKLNKTVDAKELSISLIGEKYDVQPLTASERKTRGFRSDDYGATGYKYRRYFDTKFILDKEKIYTAGKTVKYNFKLDAPSEAIGKKVPELLKPLLNLVNKDFINAIRPMTNPAEDPKWFLIARLQTNSDVDLSKRADIKIIPRGGTVPGKVR
jgi:hypothetical protein